MVQRWICDVRLGQVDEDLAAGFAAAGVQPSDDDIIRPIVHQPHEWPLGHRPYAWRRYRRQIIIDAADDMTTAEKAALLASSGMNLTDEDEILVFAAPTHKGPLPRIRSIANLAAMEETRGIYVDPSCLPGEDSQMVQ